MTTRTSPQADTAVATVAPVVPTGHDLPVAAVPIPRRTGGLERLPLTIRHFALGAPDASRLNMIERAFRGWHPRLQTHDPHIDGRPVTITVTPPIADPREIDHALAEPYQFLARLSASQFTVTRDPIGVEPEE
jgi:hypothetical protein